MLLATITILAFIVSFPPSASSQSYPTKPIIIYLGYPAGGSLDLTARLIAHEAEKMLGVPVVLENKPGGATTVATSLLAAKKPDGYTLAITSEGALTSRPHLMTLSYNPLTDFTYIMQYSRFIGSLCVLSESPIKTIDEFIVHAKANPGLSYGSPGLFTQSQLSVELLAQCKGLKFKHVPFKGGSEAIVALLGKHTDFVATGSNFPYVRGGKLRVLLNLNIDKRLPDFPNIPISKELGCEDFPGLGIIVVGPKGLPGTILGKLSKTFRQVTETPSFKELLAKNDLPFDYEDANQLEQSIPAKYEWFKNYLKKMGAKKED